MDTCARVQDAENKWPSARFVDNMLLESLGHLRLKLKMIKETVIFLSKGKFEKDMLAN